MPSSIKMSRTVILRSSKIGCSTSRMLPGVMLVRDRRSCLILDGLRRSLNILAHLNSSFTQALITELISQSQKNILFLTFSHSKKSMKIRCAPEENYATIFVKDPVITCFAAAKPRLSKQTRAMCHLQRLLTALIHTYM